MQQVLVRGLLRILPLALSLWLVWSVGRALDEVGVKLLNLVGWAQPWQGMGFVLVVVLLLVVGLAFGVRPVQWVYQKLERQILRFPIIKTIYGAVKDMASLISSDPEQAKGRKTVLVRQGNGQLVVGFITAESVPEPVRKGLEAAEEADDYVPVLIQISYQVAGITTLVRRSELIEVDWSFEDAMRYMLTAGLSNSDASTAKTPKP